MEMAIKEVRKASVLRKIFNISALVVNIFRLISTFCIFLVILGILMIGTIIVLGFQLEHGEEMILPFVLSIAYVIPAIIMFITSIISTVKCFKFGYKKVLEMVTYIISLILCFIDLIIAIVNFETFYELMIFVIPCSIVSIIIFIVAIIACAMDK